MARNGILLRTALLRGIKRRCPCCGGASSFNGYLKVVDVCPVCETPLGLYPCDDGPAYVTMLLIGHVVIGPTFLFPFFWAYPLSVVVPVLVGTMGLLTLVVLPFIKGAFLSLMWYLGLKQAR